MSQVDWSKAPEWAGCVITSCASDAERIMYWAEPWGTDGKRCQFGREDRSHRPSEDVADTSGINHSWQLIENRPVAWTGEGLPPVGIDVEIHNKSGRGVVEGAESFIGTTCKVLAAFINMNGFEMVSVEDSGGSCMCFRADMCGPVRTPKQIAAEAREQAIKDLMKIDDVYYEQAAAIYDRGYRKFEIVEE